MNLDYLRSFFAIVESNSISKAAKKLHLTQPGLSIQLQSLENEVGAKLLIRSNKGVELTEEGRVVFEHASTILSLESNIKKNIQDLKQKKSILSICACQSLGDYVLPCSIYTYREIYTDLDVFLEVYNSSTVIKKLINHETNIAIITGEYEAEGITTVPILKDNLILVSGPDEKYNSISRDELLHIPLILRDENSGSRVLLKDMLEESSIDIDDLNNVLSVNSPESIKSSITSGRGFAFLPEIVIRAELRSGALKKINIKDFDTSFSYNLIHRDNCTFTSHEERFKKFISSSKRCFC